jgi:hypothetical protein
MRTSVKLIIAAGAAAGAATLATRQWWRTWGRLPELEGEPLPGDDLVPGPTAEDTRAIEIDAPPSAVWPWLVQMGYGRAGWYSYDTMDKRASNADTIVDEWQGLAVGDAVPFQSTGGFEVATLDPERTLVLRIDTALAVAQAEAALAADPDTSMPPGISAPGGILSTTPPEFSGSWAFVLEPLEGDRTRLVERVRAWFGEGATGVSRGAPILGFGVFVMLQRHMLGVRGRAERLANERAADAGAPAVPGTEPTVAGA